MFAAAHRAVLANKVPAVELHTFVDDRTTPSAEALLQATEVLSELDEMSGQLEDPTKEELAFVNAPAPALETFPAARTDLLDLLGIRFDLLGSAPPRLAPKAKAGQEVELRIDG